MKAAEALAVLGGYTAEQWGLVTSAQASKAGVDSVTLYRLTDAGHLEQVRRGVYASLSAPHSPHRDLQAVWLSLNPVVPAWQRPKLDPDGGVVSHRSAALVHGVGDMTVDTIEVTVPRRRTSRDPAVRLRQHPLNDDDVVLIEGLPVTTLARTVEDLFADHIDASHVAAVIKDSVESGSLDVNEITERAGKHARKYGVKGRDGQNFLDHVLAQIGTSMDALARESGQGTTISPAGPAGQRALRQMVAAQILSPETERALRQMVAAQILSPETQCALRQMAAAQILRPEVQDALHAAARKAMPEGLPELLQQMSESGLPPSTRHDHDESDG